MHDHRRESGAIAGARHLGVTATGRTFWALIGGLAIAGLLQPLNISMIVIGLPAIREALGASVSEAPWVLTIYVAGLAIGQPVAGKFIDRFSRKQVFLAGVVYFGVASILAGVAWSFPFMLFARFNQAIGAAIIVPSILAIVRAELPHDSRAAAMGLIFGTYSFAGLTGPPLGALLVSTVGWRALFVISAPIAAIGLYFAVKYIPSRPPPGSGRFQFDYLGAVALSATLVALILLLTFAPEASVSGSALGVLGAGSILALILFVRRELTAPDPLVNLRLFRLAPFTYAVASQGFASIGVFVGFIAVTLFLADVRGASPQQTGIVLMGPAAATMVIAPIGGRIADRVGRRIPVLAGSVLFTASLGMFLSLGPSSPMWYFVVVMTIQGIGIALSAPAAQMASVESCPERTAGMASGVMNMVRSVAGVLGVALVGGMASGGESGLKLAVLVSAVAAAISIPLALGIHAFPRDRDTRMAGL